jgi:hypothetical protein
VLMAMYVNLNRNVNNVFCLYQNSSFYRLVCFLILLVNLGGFKNYSNTQEHKHFFPSIGFYATNMLLYSIGLYTSSRVSLKDKSSSWYVRKYHKDSLVDVGTKVDGEETSTNEVYLCLNLFVL